MKRLCIAALVVISTLLLAPPAAWAWFGRGHFTTTHAAVAGLPATVPAFFRAGALVVAHCSNDPDTWKSPAAPALTDTVAPDHYIDLELLQGKPLPVKRYDYLRLCTELNLTPDKAGLLPYAVVENTQRLTLAFAEYRRWPDDPAIQMKCLVYAGELAHYAGDMCQPLHCTIDHDGRAGPDGVSPHTGIHAKMDALIDRISVDPLTVLAGNTLEPIAPAKLHDAVMDEINASHGLVEKVYAMEAKLPKSDGTGDADKDVVDFANDRLHESARWIATLYLSAWENSAKVSLPVWQISDRERSAAMSRPATP